MKTRTKILIGLGIVAAFTVVILSKSPGKMVGGCGGSEIVALSATIQVILTTLYYVFKAAIAFGLFFCVGYVLFRLNDKVTGANDKRPPLLTSGYKTSLRYMKFLDFVTASLPAVEPVAMILGMVAFLVFFIVAASTDKLYCPINAHVGFVVATITGAVAAVVTALVLIFLAGISGYDDGRGPRRWAIRKIKESIVLLGR